MPVYAYVFSLDLYASPSTSRGRDNLFLPTRTGTMRSNRGGANASSATRGRNSAQPRPALPQASATQAEKTPAEGGQVFG